MELKTVFENLQQKNEAAFIPFITMGFPTIEQMPELLKAAEDSGADILEVGIPFSDPVADGPTVQAASEQALKNGMTLELAIEIIEQQRTKGFSLPVVLMGYANPFYAYGLKKLAKRLAKAKISGLIIPDLPPSEADEFLEAMRPQGIDIIFFISPTTSDHRLEKIAAQASGFIYCVSTTGVTGASQQRSFKSLTPLIEKTKKITTAPVCIGFGISTEEQVAEVSKICDGAIMASKLLKDLEKNPAEKGTMVFADNISKFKKQTKA
jgi:tryptophan synthase alpha chain